jgi:uracil DNA glycosylase
MLKPWHRVLTRSAGHISRDLDRADGQKKHLVLSSAHPSPFAAMKGFFGNGHFVKANEWLEERYGEKGGIDWASLGAQE